LAQDCAQTLYSWKAETPERQTFPFLISYCGGSVITRPAKKHHG